MSLMSSLPWKIHSFSYIQWLFLSEPWTYPYSLTFFLPSFMHFQLHPGYFHLEIPALPGIQVSNPPVFLVPSSLILSLSFLWCRESLFSKSATVETSVVFIFSLAESLSAFYGFITYLLNFLTSIRRKHKKDFIFLESLLTINNQNFAIP